MLRIFFIYFLFLSDSCYQCQKSYSGTSLCSVATSKIPNFDFEIQESYNHVISWPICHSEHSRKITFINQAKKYTKDMLTSQWRREQKQDTPARHPKNRQNKSISARLKKIKSKLLQMVQDDVHQNSLISARLSKNTQISLIYNICNHII